MTKALASFPETRRMAIAMRRYHGKTNGAGYRAAESYLEKTGVLAGLQAEEAKAKAPKKEKKRNDNRQPATVQSRK